MAAAAAVIVMLSLLISSSASQSQDANASLLRVVGALEKLIGFYKAEYQHMNLDGIFGLKVVEGQIQAILEEHQQGQHAHLSPQVVQRLHTIQLDAAHIGDQAIEAVRADDENYFKNLAFVITKPWSNFKRHRRIVPTIRWEIPVYRSSLNGTLNEQHSDECMMEIIGPGTDQGRDGHHCNFSHKCGRLMTRRGLMDYGITHQLLWTALAEKSGCSKELNALLQNHGFKDTDAMQVEFCTNNYYEMLAVIHVFMKGTVHVNYQDLFLEQQFVCPNLGFFEFLKKEYLDQILSWQYPSGCFGDNPQESQPQQPFKLPPKLDLTKLGAIQNPKDTSRAKSLDLQQQQQVQHQLSSLKSNNQMLKSLMDEASKRGKPQVRGSQQIQNTNLLNANPLLKNSGRLTQNVLGQDKQVPGFDSSFVRGTPQRSAGLGSMHKFNPAGNGQELGGQPPHQGLRRMEDMPVRGNWVGTKNDRVQGQPVPIPDLQAARLGGSRMRAYETQQGTGRKLLVEKTMPGGCLAHKTGVAAGALVMYLRFLIDPGPLDFFSQHEFFPKDQSILGDPEANKKIMAFLGNQMVGDLDQQNHAALEDVFGGGQHGGGGEDENEDEEDEDAEYDDQDEMYPDRGGADGVPGDGLHQEKRVVHFGANDNIADDDNASDDYDNADEDEDEEYANEDEDEEDEEEGPDYIKRVKGDDNAAANADDDNNQNEDDTEYTYYDDNDNTEKGIIKKHKPQPPPQAGARIRPHSRHKSHSAVVNDDQFRQADMPPTKTFVFLLSASSIVLIIFMYRFIKKRRIHLRYHSKGFLKL